MKRKARTLSLATPSSRGLLKSRKAPYWVRLVAGAQVGYRTGHGKAGRWLVKVTFPGIKNGRAQTALGAADDLSAADGIEVLTFDQACEKAKKWVDGVTVATEDSKILKPAKTVAEAVSDYVDYLKLEKKSSVQTDLTFACYVLKHRIARLPLSALTINLVEGWRDGIAKMPRLNRSGKAPKTPRVFATEEERDEASRKRKSTANRVLNCLKAALNRAVRKGADGGSCDWRFVGGFRKVDGIRVRFLTVREQGLLVTACGPGLCELVQGALLTGLRFGDLSKLRVRDIILVTKMLYLGSTKGGSNMAIPITTQAAEFFEAHTLGLHPSAFVFLRPDGTTWLKNQYVRPFKEAVKKAGLENMVFHELRHTFASTLLMGGANPVALARAMGHTSTRMIEKHYGHLLPGWVGAEIDAKSPSLNLAAAAAKRDFAAITEVVPLIDPRLKKRLAESSVGRTMETPRTNDLFASLRVESWPRP